MTALTRETVIGEDSPDLLSIGKAGEVGVTKRRAHLDALDPDLRERFRQPRKVAVLDHLPVRIRLTADGQSKRIGAKPGDARGEESGDGGIRCTLAEELAA